MSSGKVNIPSYIKDPSYRYKMPKMQLKQESRLNGVKTNIFNLDEIAKALRVPEEAVIKFMCAELGASKEKNTIIKGLHNFDIL
jgi:translation initiation factor 5